LVVFVLIKSKFSFLAKLFTLFIIPFCLWLIFDAIIWVTPNYYLVTLLWAPLDYLNIIFYLFALYFLIVIINGKDIENWQKVVLFAVSLPAWWLTSTGQSIVDFYQPWCEATNNSFLTNYKLVVEVAVIGAMIFFAGLGYMKSDRNKRRQIVLVTSALVLFLSIFASTEYFASITGIYEINLYSLFILPVFLAMIIFSITNLNLFAYRTFGTQLLVYILLIMVGSQFFFLQNTTYRVLTLVTFSLSLFLGVILVRNVRREERLSLELAVANEGQANLLHIMNHQIKGYLSKSRNIFSELLTEPGYKACTEEAKPLLDEGFKSLTEGVNFITDFLNASNVDKGTYKYDMQPLNFKEIAEAMIGRQKSVAEDKKLSYEVEIKDGNYEIKGDKLQLEQVVRNLIDNSIRYTPTGGLNIFLKSENDKILFTIKDTGIGIDDELKPRLFTKGGRGKDSLKININSTGFGLAFVKDVVEAHGGRVWVESAGSGTGSSFFVELPIKN
jgi:signal transduction histidine kinase